MTAAVTVPVKMNTGAVMHQLGFGTWQAKKGEVKDAVIEAVKAGFRHIDGASLYGNEDEVGEAVAELIASGVVKREDLFITTKVWCTMLKPEDVKRSLVASLRRLKMDYVDLFLVHWPIAFVNKQKDVDDIHDRAILFPVDPATGVCERADVPLSATWTAMEAVYDEKLTRAIGVSNVPIPQLEELLKTARVVPAVNQVEAHPGLPQDELRAYHQSKGIVTQAYCPLGIGMGDLSKSLLQHPRIAEIAATEGVSAGELLLRWNLQTGNVVLSKSVTPARILSNAKTTTAPLSEAATKALAEFGVKYPLRVCNPPIFGKTKGTTYMGDGLPASY